MTQSIIVHGKTRVARCLHEREFYPEKDVTRQQVAKSTQNRDSKATVTRTTKRVKSKDSLGQKKTLKTSPEKRQKQLKLESHMIGNTSEPEPF